MTTTTLRTALEVEPARALLRDYGLKLLALDPLPRGTINSNYRVTTDAGPLFLRINEGKTDPEVRFEADLIWHLTSHGVRTPAVWRTGRGQPYLRLPASPETCGGTGKQLMLMAWAPGEELGEDDIGEGEARSVGAVLAGLHRGARGFPGRRAGVYTLGHIEARVQRLHHEPRIPDGTIEYLQRELLRLKSTRGANLPMGIGHNDLFPDNLLFTPGKRRREVAWILDLEQAATLPYVYDLAVALLSFCAPVNEPEPDGPNPKAPQVERVGPLLLRQARAMIEGYCAVRPLSPGERLALYEEARFAALRFTVTRLTDVHLRRAEPGRPADAPGPSNQPSSGHSSKHSPRHSKDYRDFLRRLELLDALGAAAFNDALAQTP